MKKQLFTCSAGVSLLNDGHRFTAFEETDEKEIAISRNEFYTIIVDEDDVSQRTNIDSDGMYDVFKGAKVEVIAIPLDKNYR
jgi:hypothetical protein